MQIGADLDLYMDIYIYIWISRPMYGCMFPSLYLYMQLGPGPETELSKLAAMFTRSAARK